MARDAETHVGGDRGEIDARAPALRLVRRRLEQLAAAIDGALGGDPGADAWTAELHRCTALLADVELTPGPFPDGRIDARGARSDDVSEARYRSELGVGRDPRD